MSEAIDWSAVTRLLVVVLGEAAIPAIAAMMGEALPHAEVKVLSAQSHESSGQALWHYDGDRYRSSALIPRIQGADAAIILTAPGQSPYAAGYLCYLADIPIRMGQSCEFGGGVLSHGLPPPESSPFPAALLAAIAPAQRVRTMLLAQSLDLP